jgi:hypothetical protein
MNTHVHTHARAVRNRPLGSEESSPADPERKQSTERKSHREPKASKINGISKSRATRLNYFLVKTTHTLARTIRLR